MAARRRARRWGQPRRNGRALTDDEKAVTDKQTWLNWYDYGLDPLPVVLEPVEGSHPYRTTYREPERPEGFWRGVWRRLTGFFG